MQKKLCHLQIASYLGNIKLQRCVMANPNNPSVLIAAEVEYEKEKKCPSASDLTLYFQNPKNGGCEVLGALTPYQGNPAKAIVVFHPDSCEEGE